MENNNENYESLKDENIQTIDVESETAQNATEEEKEITALPYQFIFDGVYSNAKVLGQVVFIDKNDVESATSNTVSIIRMLSNGEKQFFKITVEETKELTIKK